VRTVRIPDHADLERAAEVVRRTLAVTPVVAAPLLGPNVWLKLETLQPTGAFKVRGGLAAVSAARQGGAPIPLVSSSAGNHGLGMAYAAECLGADVSVVVPETASEAKVEALGRFTVALLRHGRSYEEAEARALELADEKGGRYVSPYNDPDVIAGQGTIGLELLQQLPGLAEVVVPVGGGGLLSGIGLATAPAGVRLVGVEPARSAPVAAAIEAGHVVPVDVGPTMADGLAGNIEPGSVTVGLAARLATEMHTVTEEEIAAAIRFLAFSHGIVAEGAGAVAVANLLSGRHVADDGPVVVVVSGRNITPALLASVLAS
jgi:threonine dehydratase